MKKLSIVSILLSSLLCAGSLSPDEITNMVKNIKKERAGIALTILEKTENPFIIHKKKKTVENVKKEATKEVHQEVVYTLHAILNHAAFIDGKWYKKGDKLGTYRIGYIGKQSVTLSSKFAKKTLQLKKRKNKFINLNKGKK